MRISPPFEDRFGQVGHQQNTPSFYLPKSVWWLRSLHACGSLQTKVGTYLRDTLYTVYNITSWGQLRDNNIKEKLSNPGGKCGHEDMHEESITRHMWAWWRHCCSMLNIRKRYRRVTSPCVWLSPSRVPFSSMFHLRRVIRHEQLVWQGQVSSWNQWTLRTRQVSIDETRERLTAVHGKPLMRQTVPW